MKTFKTCFYILLFEATGIILILHKTFQLDFSEMFQHNAFLTSNKFCLVRCICTYFVTGHFSAEQLVVSANGKLQTLRNWFLSCTLLSLGEFILLVSTKGLPPTPHLISLETLHFQKSVFFFLHQETMPFDHI